MYGLIGQRVKVHLFTVEGILMGAVEGRVADIAKQVAVAPGMHKDLALVVDITLPDTEEPYVNSSGLEGEGWFAVQDIEPLDGTVDGLRSYQHN